MTRSVFSIPSNMGDSAGSSTVRDYRQFLDITKGSRSITELRTQLDIANRIGQLNSKIIRVLVEETKVNSARTQALVN